MGKIMKKGLIVNIYRSYLGQDRLSVLPSGVTRVIAFGENIPEIFEESKDMPAVHIRAGKSKGTVVAVPNGHEHKLPMYGGSFVSTSDSRFSSAVAKLLGTEHFYGAIPLCDRVEMS